jgi:hypothetical protein
MIATFPSHSDAETGRKAALAAPTNAMLTARADAPAARAVGFAPVGRSHSFLWVGLLSPVTLQKDLLLSAELPKQLCYSTKCKITAR